MLVELGRARRRARPLRAPRAVRRDRPRARAEGAGRARGRAAPILCVGETEEERDDGDTERKLRHQIAEDLAGVPAERLAEVVIAYEPIWAIGTGRVASPEQAQEAIAFIRALVGDRDARGGRARADPLRRLGQARERRRAAGAPGRRRRARRRRLAGGATRSRRSPSAAAARSGASPRDAPGRRPATLPARVRVPGRARRLGSGRAGPRQRGLAGRTPVFDELWAQLPAHHADAPAAARSGCPKGRWATPRSAT